MIVDDIPRTEVRPQISSEKSSSMYLLFLIGLLEYDLSLLSQIRNSLLISLDFLNQIVH